MPASKLVSCLLLIKTRQVWYAWHSNAMEPSLKPIYVTAVMVKMTETRSSFLSSSLKWRLILDARLRSDAEHGRLCYWRHDVKDRS